MLNTTIDEHTIKDILKSEPLIYDLIYHYKVNPFSPYPELPDTSESFLDLISPLYFQAFKHILEDCKTNKTEGKILKLLQSPAYCNSDTYNRIIDILCQPIRENNKKNEQYISDLEENIQTVNGIYNQQGFRMFQNIDIIVYNTLSHPEVKALKKETVHLTIRVFKSLSPYIQNDIAMVLQKQNRAQLDKLNLSEEFKQKHLNFKKVYSAPSFKLTGKSIISIILAIFSIGKLIMMITS